MGVRFPSPAWSPSVDTGRRRNPRARPDPDEAIVLRVPGLRGIPAPGYQACSVPQCGQSTEVDTAAVKAKPHMQE